MSYCGLPACRDRHCQEPRPYRGAIGDFAGVNVVTNPWMPDDTIFILSDTMFDFGGFEFDFKWDDPTPDYDYFRTLDYFNTFYEPNPSTYQETVLALGYDPLPRTPKSMSLGPFAVSNDAFRIIAGIA